MCLVANQRPPQGDIGSIPIPSSKARWQSSYVAGCNPEDTGANPVWASIGSGKGWHLVLTVNQRKLGSIPRLPTKKMEHI